MAIEKQEMGLVKYQAGQMSVSDLRLLAGDFAKSGYFADAKEVFQAVVKIQAGIELGFGPVYSMTKIYIVKGKVTVSAEALGAMVKRSGRYDYQVKTLTNTECTLEFTDRDKVVYVSKFNMDDAERADLVKQDSGWVKWPRAMLMSKALSQGARIVCPHVIAGVYTPADFGVETNERGEPIPGAITVESRDIHKEVPPVEMLTESQRKKMFAVARERGRTNAAIHSLIEERYQAHHINDLTQRQAAETIHFLEALPTTEELKAINEELKAIDKDIVSVIMPQGVVAVTESGKTQKPKRDPKTINSLGDLFTACHTDFGMQSSQVIKELGYESKADISELPSECYQKIVAVRCN